MNEFRHYVRAENVETQVQTWGLLQWLSEPRVTGAKEMVTGIVTIEPGQGHAKHNHPGCAEVLFVLKGTGEQMVYTDKGELKKTVTPGDLIYLEPGQFHSTINIGKDNMEILAVYQVTGPEIDMGKAAVKILPPTAKD